MPLVLLLIMIMSGVALCRWYQRTCVTTQQSAVSDILGSTSIGLGIVLLLAPPALNWLVHGSYERRIWVLHGPPPFNMLGGGPLQMWSMFVSVMIGYGLIALGLGIRHHGQGF